MIQAHIFVSGMVQGVGYRAFVIHIARKMGIHGWTRNLSDGRVEILAQGSKETIERFTRRLWRGSMLSEVRDIVVEHDPITQKFFTFQKESTI